MEMSINKMLNVTDISTYIYCPRKFFLQKIKGVKNPPTKEMIEGRIRHEILEAFSQREQGIAESLKEMPKEKIISIYNQILMQIINQSFQRNRNSLLAFKISPENLQAKIINSMGEDFSLRADSILKAFSLGYSGKELWENLSPKYISEFRLSSEELGLKGRADRIMFSENSIIPFELKTREQDRLFLSDEIQLTAYAVLLEEFYRTKIPLGILEAGNKKHEVHITEDLRQKLFSIMNEIKSLTNSSKVKFPSSFAKCQKCLLAKECEAMG